MTLFSALEAKAAEAAAASLAHEQRLRKHEADFTVRPIARRLVSKVMPLVVHAGVVEVLDINAGAGVFASEVLRWAVLHGVRVHITAVEIRDEERQWLLRTAHKVVIADWHAGLGMRRVTAMSAQWMFAGQRRFDLVIGNPAFRQARAPLREGWPAPRHDNDGNRIKPTVEETATRKRLTAEAVAAGLLPELAEYDPAQSMPALCIQCAPVVALYGTQQMWTKTASGWLVREHLPPALAWDIPGSLGHRGQGAGQDRVPYSMTIWKRGHDGATATRMLEPIPSGDRNWTMRPGTEPIEWLEANGIPYLTDGIQPTR